MEKLYPKIVAYLSPLTLIICIGHKEVKSLALLRDPTPIKKCQRLCTTFTQTKSDFTLFFQL